MKPQDFEAVSVQEIRNNPVEGEQKALRVQREGVLGWLSYVGYMCVVAFPALILSLLNVSSGYSYTLDIDDPRILTGFDTGLYIESYISFPFYSNQKISMFILATGIMLMGFSVWKSKYPMTRKSRIILTALLGVLMAIMLLFCYALDYETVRYFGVISFEIGKFVFYSIIGFVWICLLGWYLRYFYYKAKDGYKFVWIKVLLFTLLPFISLLFGTIETIETVETAYE